MWPLSGVSAATADVLLPMRFQPRLGGARYVQNRSGNSVGTAGRFRRRRRQLPTTGLLRSTSERLGPANVVIAVRVWVVHSWSTRWVSRRVGAEIRLPAVRKRCCAALCPTWFLVEDLPPSHGHREATLGSAVTARNFSLRRSAAGTGGLPSSSLSPGVARGTAT